MEILFGSKFFRLTVVAKASRHKYFVCQCDCGKLKEVRKDHLTLNKIRSCGCLRDELASDRTDALHKARTTHGMSGSRIYSIWRGMFQRCENPKATHYNRYGGRGITVCERWRSFDNFYEDMKSPPPGMTIERRNNDLGYSPDNCHWATRSEQQNNRVICRHVTWNGETHTIAEWSEKTGIHRNTLTARLDSEIPLDQVFSKEKIRDISGFALGAKISQAARLARTHCSKGHEYTPENTLQTTRQRFCRTCHNERQRARNAAKRAA